MEVNFTEIKTVKRQILWSKTYRLWMSSGLLRQFQNYSVKFHFWHEIARIVVYQISEVRDFSPVTRQRWLQDLGKRCCGLALFFLSGRLFGRFSLGCRSLWGYGLLLLLRRHNLRRSIQSQRLLPFHPCRLNCGWCLWVGLLPSCQGLLGRCVLNCPLIDINLLFSLTQSWKIAKPSR